MIALYFYDALLTRATCAANLLKGFSQDFKCSIVKVEAVECRDAFAFSAFSFSAYANNAIAFVSTYCGFGLINFALIGRVN